MTQQGKEVITIGCYAPLIRAEYRNKWKTAADGHKYREFKIFSDEQLEKYDYMGTMQELTNFTPIPCGNCIGCRLDYSRDWANRGYLESTLWEQNYFVTLTYDDKHIFIPEEVETEEGITYTEIIENGWKGMLVPKDFTQFVKNFRQIMQRDKIQADGIRFIGCGEYGTQAKRPHYHLILFNCKLPQDSFYAPHLNWQKNTTWKNTIIERAWGKGIIDIAEANWNTIAYVARYITKKVNGKESEDFYAMQGQLKEFFRSSNQPGIGWGYYQKHKKEIYKYDKILIQNQKGSHWVKPPKYFDMLYERENPLEFEKIKKKRREEMIKQLKIKDKTTSLNRWEQLQLEKRTKETAQKALIRPGEF